MLCEKIDLYDYFKVKRTGNEKGFLNVYIPEAIEYPERFRPAMLVIAGGGYSFVAGREQECVGISYMTKGFAAFTLEYSCAPTRFPAQLLEGAMAIAYIRENAEILHILKDKVAAIGFSAGGHLAGMLATIYDAEEVVSVLKERAVNCRPDAVILSYPVITSGEKAHVGSFDSLCGDDPASRKKVSLENCVTENSSPAFIWATADDGIVPSENSLLMATAYKKKGVPFELHIFASGRHGLSLANEETAYVNLPVQPWLNLSFTWLAEQGFKIKD